ncbi:universal stress protein A [Catellatospora methionotrophica]|uniref:Universal stress protein A n=1 Tax=Catellatospora methionotrophica TaxID=121620 RepID=A0A8J3PEY8_9ACTN|nr:universal stress protein [Catellatospora methionotrophica]GIG14687.1 universal stress protein A [Catellatospora methionotrophica]
MDVPQQRAEHYGPAAAPCAFERGTDGPRVIMVGVDGSPTSERAAAYAAGLARRQRSRLVVVFVGEHAGLVGAIYGQAAAAVVETAEELAAELREQVRRAAEEMDLPVTFVVRRGDAYAELRAAADELKADMLVVGASAQAGHRFVGSVATRLVKQGRWPVVVVP